jgi:hypothetical protein
MKESVKLKIFISPILNAPAKVVYTQVPNLPIRSQISFLMVLTCLLIRQQTLPEAHMTAGLHLWMVL